MKVSYRSFCIDRQNTMYFLKEQAELKTEIGTFTCLRSNFCQLRRVLHEPVLVPVYEQKSYLYS